jgi:cytochrome P450
MPVQTLLWMQRPVELMHRSMARYGDTFRMDIAGTPPVLLTGNPEYVRAIFTGDDEDMRGGEVNGYLAPLLGDTSIFLLDGAKHLRQRRLMLPPFHGERMRVYASAMRDITLARIANWRDAEPIVLRHETQAITFELILSTVFGVDGNDELRALQAPLLRMLAVAESTAGTFSLIPALRFNFPGSPWRRFLHNRADADREILSGIERRRRQAGQGRSDVLSLMLEARDEQGEGMTDAELRDELMTLLIAGHESTATAICWTFECLLANSAATERVTRELREVCGSEPPAPEHLNRLDYLDAVIKESLRLRPVLPISARKLRAPMQLGPHEVPAGWIAAPSMFMAHYNPSAYAEPTAFRPERFFGMKPDPYAWFPFGGGSRRCLGLPFALYEMKVVIATILSRKRLELAQRRPVRPMRRVITVAPEHGLRVTCHPLSPPAYAVPAGATASPAE